MNEMYNSTLGLGKTTETARDQTQLKSEFINWKACLKNDRMQQKKKKKG